jgi:hypothetical protein
MQSEVPPPAYQGLHEIVLSADRAVPHLIHFRAFDAACQSVQSYTFGDDDNAAAFLFAPLPVLGPVVMVEAEALACGASGSRRRLVVFAPRPSGKAWSLEKTLAFDHENTDGIAFAPLPSGHLGIAEWSAQWAEGEAHDAPHRYQVALSAWDGKQLRAISTQTTGGKYDPIGDDGKRLTGPSTPLADGAVVLPESLKPPSARNWDNRFQPRPTGLDPKCGPNGPEAALGPATGGPAASAGAGCLAADPHQVVMQSEAPPPAFAGVREITLSAERAKPHVIHFTAFDAACHGVASYRFGDDYNSAAFLFVDLPALGPVVAVEAQAWTCGGSGFGLLPVVFTLRNGRLTKLPTPDLEHDNMAGYAFAPLASGQLALVQWSGLWEGKQAHYDNHRYAISLFAWDGTFFHRFSRPVTQARYDPSDEEGGNFAPSAPLSDPTVGLAKILKAPLPTNWDKRFSPRQTGLDPKCTPDGPEDESDDAPAANAQPPDATK